VVDPRLMPKHQFFQCSAIGVLCLFDHFIVRRAGLHDFRKWVEHGSPPLLWPFYAGEGPAPWTLLDGLRDRFSLIFLKGGVPLGAIASLTDQIHGKGNEEGFIRSAINIRTRMRAKSRTSDKTH